MIRDLGGNMNNLRRYIDIVEQRGALLESTPRTLYHGTLRKFLPTILRQGLWPSVGAFTERMYGGETEGGELQDLVFAADKQGIVKCFSAIASWIRIEYGGLYTVALVKQHGALCVLKHAEDDFDHHAGGDDWSDHIQVEPRDYFSDQRVRVSFVLTGNKMMNFIAKHAGIRPEGSQRPQASGQRIV